MSKHTLTFRITDRQLTALDNAARQANSSREDMARSVLALGLATLGRMSDRKDVEPSSTARGLTAPSGRGQHAVE